MRYPNVELGVRDYLRTQSGLTSVLNGDSRLIDLDPDPAKPCVSVYLVSGYPNGYLPIQPTVLGFDCWGTNRSRLVSMNLRDALVDVLTSMASEPLNATAFGYGASINSDIWRPTSDGRSRYVVTATITARQLADAS